MEAAPISKRVQLLALLRKNVLLTTRNRRDACREFGSPILMTTILVVISSLGGRAKLTAPDRSYPSVPVPALASLLPRNASLLVSPCGPSVAAGGPNVTAFATALAALTGSGGASSSSSSSVRCFPCETGANADGTGPCVGLPGSPQSLVGALAADPSGTLAGVVFDSWAPDYPVSYRLRLDEDRYAPGATDSLYIPGWGAVGGIGSSVGPLPPSGAAGAWVPAVVPLLAAVNQAILQSMAGAGLNATHPTLASLSLRQFPSLSYAVNAASVALGAIVPLYFTLIFTLQVRVLLTRILEEKERKTKLSLQVHGLSDSVFWLSWLITAGVKNVVVVALVVTIAVVGGIFPHSDASVILVFFALYALTAVAYACAVTSLFSKARTGGAIGMLIYLALSGPAYALTSSAGGQALPEAAKLAFALIAPIGFTMGASVMTSAEQAGVGITWSTAGDPTVSPIGVALTSLMGVLVVDIVLYTLLAVYLNKVVPTEFGIPLHPCFCLGFRRATVTAGQIDDIRAARHSHLSMGGTRNKSGRGAKGGSGLAARLLSALGLRGAGTRAAAPIPVRDWRGSAQMERAGLVADANVVVVGPASPAAMDAADVWKPNPSLAAASAASLLRKGGPAAASSTSASSSTSYSPSSAHPSLHAADFEPLAPELANRDGVHFRGACKLFAGRGSEPTRLAVDDLSLSLHEGVVTALLGHNGAGKSTAVSLAIGLYQLTAGDIVAYGKSVVNDIAGVRAMMGVCPQHDILYPELTPREHLRLFGGVKGKFGAALEERVERLLRDLGLTEKADSQAGTLSGGQKRRLSVAIALVGDPKVVFLDEPSSGLDPAGRRQVWNVIQQHKQGRVFLVSTHHMEEAEILGERIALMARGSLRVWGSPLFLKNRFGLGYSLSITTLPSAQAPGAVSAEGQMTAWVQGHVRSATLRGASVALLGDAKSTAGGATTSSSSSSGLELTYVLPRDHVSSFPALLEGLDACPPLPVAGYSVAQPTMEDVFLSLATLVDDEERAERDAFIAAAAAEAGAGAPIEVEEAEVRGATAAGKGGETDVDDADVRWWLDVRRRLYGHSREELKRGVRLEEEEGTSPAVILARLRASTSASSSSPWVRFRRQLAAQLRRRYLQLARDPRVAWLQCVTPIIFVGVSLAFQALRGLGDLAPPAPVSFSVQAMLSGGGLPSSSSPGVVPAAFSLPTAILRPPADPTLDAYMASLEAAFASGVPVIPGPYPGPAQPTTASAADAILLRNTSYAAGAALVSSVSPGPMGTYSLLLSYNTSLPTSPPTLVTLWGSAILRQALGGSAPPAGTGPLLQSAFDPFPRSLLADPASVQQASAGGGGGGFTVQASVGDFIAAQLLGLYTALGMCTIPALQASAVVAERESKSKQLQFIMGATPLGYWAATWLFDILMFLVPWVGGLAVIYAAGPAVLGGANAAGPALLLLALGVAVPLPTYALSFAFSTAAEAQVWVRISYTTLTAALFFTSFGLSFPGVATALPSLRAAVDVVRYVGYAFPPFALAKGLADMGSLSTSGPGSGLGAVLAWNVAGAPLFYLVLSVPVWLAVILAIEYAAVGKGPAAMLFPGSGGSGSQSGAVGGGMSSGGGAAGRVSSSSSTSSLAVGSRDSSSTSSSLSSSLNSSSALVTPLRAGATGSDDVEDDDVRAERARVERTVETGGGSRPADEGLAAVALRKVFVKGVRSGAGRRRRRRGASLGRGSGPAGAREKVAVADLSLACPTGEVFGLLGPNGAGKTTTISCFVAEMAPTSGNAFIAGLDTTSARRQALDRLGFCPQFDALFDLLTGEETLAFYAAVAGVPDAHIPPLVDDALTTMGLQPYRRTRAAHYSGGNKRRLSLALAFIGAPLVAFLDEPSTGVDPFARRKLFETVIRARANRTTVLTTHVLEEAEALCARIGIMVGGRLACLGSAQRLKNRYGRGYVVEVRFKHAGGEEEEEGGAGAKGGVPLSAGEADFDGAVASVVALLGGVGSGVVVAERHGSHARLEAATLRLAGAFRALESSKTALGILDYSLSQTTLEQVFLRFSAAQEEADAAAAREEEEEEERAGILAGRRGM